MYTDMSLMLILIFLILLDFTLCFWADSSVVHLTSNDLMDSKSRGTDHHLVSFWSQKKQWPTAFSLVIEWLIKIILSSFKYKNSYNSYSSFSPVNKQKRTTTKNVSLKSITSIIFKCFQKLRWHLTVGIMELWLSLKLHLYLKLCLL